MPGNHITMYHNPRCSKSRATLELVQDYLAQRKNNVELTVVEYLSAPLTVSKLASLKSALGVATHDMMRSKEAAYAEHGLGENSTDDELLAAIVQSPILLERPIVEYAGRAAIGRPPEQVLAVLPQ